MNLLTRLKKLLYPWVEPRSEDPLEAHRERMLNYVLLGLGLPGIAFTLLFLVGWGLGRGPVSLIGALTGLVVQPFYLLSYRLGRRGKIQTAAYIPIAVLFLVMVGNTFLLGIGHSVLVGFAMVIVISGILLGTGPALLLVFFITVLYLTAGLAQMVGRLPYAVSPVETFYLDSIGVSLGLLTIVVFSWLSRTEVVNRLSWEQNLVAELESRRVSLEQRVSERTQDLERRVIQLETVTRISREAAGIRDVTELLRTVVRVMAEQFPVSHVNIFLLDDRREYAVLQAASSELGRRLLDRGYRQEVGGSDVVGYVSQSGKPLVVLDVDVAMGVGLSPAFPGTRSELGLPLQVREEVIGVLDLHSTETAAFSEDDVGVLGTMADQIALAIENARLLESSRRALRELEALYGRQVREAWRERNETYRYTGTDVVSERDSLPLPEGGLVAREPVVVQDETGRRLVAPILLRGQKLGSIVLRQTEDVEPWTSDELALINEIGVQIGLALENARLLEETRRRAEREQMLGEMTARFTRSLDMDAMLRAAVRELSRLPHVTEVSVHVGPSAWSEGENL